MSITLDFSQAMAEAIGADHGVSQAELEALTARAPELLAAIDADRRAGKLGFFDLPHAHEADVKAIEEYAARVKGRYRNIVVLGIGGSALGSLVLQNALNRQPWNLRSDSARGGFPRYFLVDNVDPEMMQGVLDTVRLDETLFIVISKSGGTPETAAAFRHTFELVRRHVGERWVDHFALVTDPKSGWLREIATTFSVPSFVIPPNVGGRFSVFTAVGLLPAALLGLDIRALLKGAAHANAVNTPDNFPGNWPFIVAALHHLADTKKGKPISVMMPYSQALKDFADWYTQLWAESLGKAKDLDGQPVCTGQTPVKALGATDQHSQLQLYLEGPADKIITMLATKRFRVDCVIHEPPLPSDTVKYLDHHTFAEVLHAELDGTRGALAECQRPVISLTMDAITPENIGELLHGYMIATAIAGRMYHVDAFDQPGVELGKRIAKRILAGEK